MKRFVMLSVAVVSSLLLASDAAAGWGRGGCSGGSCYSGGYSSGGCSGGSCYVSEPVSSGCAGGVCYTGGAPAHASAPAPYYAARPATQPTRYYFVQNGRTYYYYAYPRAAAPAAAPAQVVRQSPAAVARPSVVSSQPQAPAKAISTPVQR